MASPTTIPRPETDHEQREHRVKRRRSEEPDDAVDGKRQRISPGKNSPTATRDDATDDLDNNGTLADQHKPTNTDGTRRKSSTVDEKQRSKRLFGALLGNLRQPGDRTSKRREEIEARRRAELQRQDDERIQDRQRRLEQLLEQRKITQMKVDEQNMHRRHRAMLEEANFLQTGTEPILFYRPWDLRDGEEDRIDDQIRDAEDIVSKEVAEFNKRRGGESIPPDSSETYDTDIKDEPPRLEDNAEDNNGTLPRRDGRDSAQDQASAKSDSGEHAKMADAPDEIPATNIDTANDEDDDKVEEVRPSSHGEGNEDVEYGEHEHYGDEVAVIY